MPQTEIPNLNEEDEIDFEIPNVTEAEPINLEQGPPISSEQVSNHEKFQHGSLEGVKNSLGLDFSEWEKTAESLGGDVLKKGGKELLFETAEGQKVSTTEQVKGSTIESFHLQILDGLYGHGYAVSEYISHGPGEPSRELHVYFADEKGRVSYEIYKFKELSADENIAQSPEQANPQDLAPGLSPIVDEPTVISLDEILESSRADIAEGVFIFSSVEQKAPRFFTEPAVEQDEFNFQEFFVREPQSSQATTDPQPSFVEAKTAQPNIEDSFGIELIFSEPVRQKVETANEAVGDLETAESVQEAPIRTIESEANRVTAPLETGQLAEPTELNTNISTEMFAKVEEGESLETTEEEDAEPFAEGRVLEGARLLSNNRRSIITRAPTARREVPLAPKKEAASPLLEKTGFRAEIPALKIEPSEEIIPKDEQKAAIKIQAEPERQYVQNVTRKTDSRLIPIVKFYNREVAQKLIRTENQISTFKIEASQEIIAEIEPEDINNPKAELGREYRQDKPSHYEQARQVKKEENPTLKIEVSEQIITEDEPITETVPHIIPDVIVEGRNIREAFYDFLEQKGKMPEQKPVQQDKVILAKPFTIKNKLSAAPRVTLEILKKMIPPQKEAAIQINRQVAHVRGVKPQPLRIVVSPKYSEGHSVKARPTVPPKPNIFQQITLLSSPNLKSTPQPPVIIKAIPIEQTVLTTEERNKTPKPGTNEINSRRAIPIDQIIDEKNNHPASSGQAAQIAA